MDIGWVLWGLRLTLFRWALPRVWEIQVNNMTDDYLYARTYKFELMIIGNARTDHKQVFRDNFFIYISHKLSLLPIHVKTAQVLNWE